VNTILKTLSNWCIGFGASYWVICVLLWRFLDERVMIRLQDQSPQVITYFFFYHIAIPVAFTILAIILRKVNDVIFAEKLFIFRQLEDLKKQVEELKQQLLESKRS